MPESAVGTLFADKALLPDGWARNVSIRYDMQDGCIEAVEKNVRPEAAERAGIVVPGMPNLHSHAFQRAMAGRAEYSAGPGDSFWTWRETMYELVSRLNPDDIEAIAAQTYAEMLCQGYTSVAEFHYLHNRPDGGRYDNPAETALRIAAAAETSGIGLALLPVLYCRGGFSDEPLSAAQERFRSDPEFLAAVAAAAEGALANARFNRTGLAIHSLRAAAKEDIETAVANQTSRDVASLIHIHIAEQLREVTECHERTGRTPVEWLYEHFDVDGRWCLVHATNVTGSEIGRIAESGAIAGLCPTTEANLGDGVFPLIDYIAGGGKFGIGSDSQVSLSPAEELRWLEYGQRLALRRRNVAATDAIPSVGGYLWRAALNGGSGALGLKAGAIEAGHRADLLVLDHCDPLLEGRDGDAILDSLVFAGGRPLMERVLSGGKWVVEGGRHISAASIEKRYLEAIRRLFQT